MWQCTSWGLRDLLDNVWTKRSTEMLIKCVLTVTHLAQPCCCWLRQTCTECEEIKHNSIKLCPCLGKWFKGKTPLAKLTFDKLKKFLVLVLLVYISSILILVSMLLSKKGHWNLESVYLVVCTILFITTDLVLLLKRAMEFTSVTLPCAWKGNL